MSTTKNKANQAVKDAPAEKAPDYQALHKEAMERIHELGVEVESLKEDRDKTVGFWVDRATRIEKTLGAVLLALGSELPALSDSGDFADPEALQAELNRQRSAAEIELMKIHRAKSSAVPKCNLQVRPFPDGTPSNTSVGFSQRDDHWAGHKRITFGEDSGYGGSAVIDRSLAAIKELLTPDNTGGTTPQGHQSFDSFPPFAGKNSLNVMVWIETEDKNGPQ